MRSKAALLLALCGRGVAPARSVRGEFYPGSQVALSLEEFLLTLRNLSLFLRDDRFVFGLGHWRFASRMAVSSLPLLGVVFLLALIFGGGFNARAEGVGSRVFVVERSLERVAVYDFLDHTLHAERIAGLGDLHHATMTFSPDLRYGFLAARSGQLSRIDLEALRVDGTFKVSENSIDIAISQDGRFIATAEYAPGGVTIVDARTMKLAKQILVPGGASRVTGLVDGLKNRFICVLMEGREVWQIDASRPDFPIEKRIPLDPKVGLPYDAMITPDGRYYIVGHLGEPEISLIDLRDENPKPRLVSLLDPKEKYDRSVPVKLPHMASWAVAGDKVFVPLVGEKRLVVLDRTTWSFVQSIPVRGNPVYAVRAPSEQEIWVSFSGEEDDSFVQVIDTQSLEVKKTLELGGRIYHMDFTPRGAYALITANRANKLFLVNASTYAIEDEKQLESPSGVFGVWRAFRIGL